MRLHSTAHRTDDFEPFVGSIAPRADNLGSVLLRSGYVTQPQLDAIAGRQRETGRLFGETAIELGLVSREDVERAIAQQQSFYLLEWGDDRLDPAVVAAFNPHDAIARCAREIRGRIVTSELATDRPVKTVLMLSVGVPVEASLITANLGVSCAQAGYRTLLVDANVDAPMQHGLFRRPNRVGLTNALSRSVDLNEAICPTAIPKLSLIPAGTAVPNSNELLERERLFLRLMPIAHEFDLILVDASHADEADIAVFDGADGAVLTVRRDSSGMRSFRAMADQLEAADILAIGSAFVD
jgi:protein-tyrosine kinase